MMDLEFTVSVDDHRNLHLTEISRRTFEEQSLGDLESDFGTFIVLEDTCRGSFEVLAKVASFSAGRSLIEMMTRAGRLTAVAG